VTHSVVCHKSPLFFTHACLVFPGSLADSAAHAQKSVSFRDKCAVLHLSMPCMSTCAVLHASGCLKAARLRR
jgi:hypothetical protein